MKGSDLLVSALENEGVERIFGIPGEENLDIVESLRRSRIRLVLTRHEQAAAFMAATHGRLTGKSGVCLTTLGPGALNLTTGAAHALLGAMPMVIITWSERDFEPEAGTVPGRGCRLDDHEAADEDGAPDRQHGDNSVHRARGLPTCAARKAGPGAFGSAGGHRTRRGARNSPRETAPGRYPGCPSRGAGPSGRPDPQG